MPWMEIKPMDQKIQLIADWQTKQFTKIDLSKKYGISRKTVYKWIQRYEMHNIDGLKELDRARHHHPNITPKNTVDLIIAKKRAKPKRGPKKLYRLLKDDHPDIHIPAPSTIGDWLKKYGLVKKRKRRVRVPPYTQPLHACKSPNDVWSADYKGQFYMRNGSVCYPLTISDNASRYILKCQALPGPRYRKTKQIFEEAFKENGLPNAIRIDNGTPFAGKAIGGLSRLMIWWILLGITPERIRKGCPQDNPRHERMHRTLKDEALENIARNLKEQQKEFDIFRFEFNNCRPHESLDQDMPNMHYRKSSRPYIENPISPDYDFDYTVRNVRHNGEIKFKGNLYYLTRLLTGYPIGLKEVADGQWNIYFSFYQLGALDLRKNKIIKKCNPCTRFKM
jgi:transposase InsO family protein